MKINLFIVSLLVMVFLVQQGKNVSKHRRIYAGPNPAHGLEQF